jgi:signal transduction histidine kinase
MLRETIMNSVASAYQNKIIAEIRRGRAGPMFLQRAVRNVGSASQRLCSAIAERTRGLIGAVAARGKVHHVYFALAAFDLAAVGGGFYLNELTQSALTRALEVKVTWSRRFGELEGLREAADGLVSPAYRAFGSDNPARESADFAKNAENVDQELRVFRSSIEKLFIDDPLAPPAPGEVTGGGSEVWRHKHIGMVLERLISIEAAMYSMIDRTRGLLAHHTEGNTAQAATSVSDVERQHLGFRKHADALLRELRQAEQDLVSEQFAYAEELKAYEYVLGAMIILMVCAVTCYGHWLGTLFQRRYDELQEATTAARAAEAKSRAYAEQLETAHEHVTKLNSDLGSNIRKLREAQDEMVRKGKLAQLGQLTATVAHEIRNPLGAVRTASFLIERKVKDKGLGLETQLQRINNGIKRCDTIITELLDFARSRSLNLESVTIDGWVRATVEEEQKAFPSLVQIALQLDLGDACAAIDTGRMRRVLINLLSNASEAMVGRGADIVTVAPRIQVTTRRAGANIEIEVADNGPGISAENLKKIFEPLFTTKSFGVGLGLPAVEQILEQHGGGLRVASTLGEGARMTAWFPIERANGRTA